MMKISIIKNIILAVITFVALPAFGAEYYFSQSTGNDTTGDGLSINTAWQTIAKANTVGSPSDTLCFKCGDVWTEQTILIPRAGVIYTSYGPGDKPHLDHSGESGEYTRVVELNYGVDENTQIKNLRITAGTSPEYFAIEHTNKTQGGNRVGLIYNCDIYHSYSGTVTATKAGLINYNCAVELSYCYGESLCGRGFANAEGNDMHIHHNTIKCAEVALKIGDGGLRDNVIVENNYIIMTSGATLLGGMYIKGIENFIVRNNVVDARNSGIPPIHIISGGWGIHGGEIYDNTIIGDTSSYNGIDTLNSCDYCDTLSIKNNIIVGFDYPVFIGDDYDSCTISYNDFYNNQSNTVRTGTATNITVSDNITSDPNINYAGDDPDPYFALSSNTPCGDSGIDDDADIPDSDYAGTARVNSHWIGAFEYDVGGDSTPPVRSNGAPSGILQSGTTQTTMSLTTDESCTCKYDTDGGEAYAAMANTFSTTGGASHSQTISGLSDGNSYTYYVRCEDESSNANTDDYEISWSVAEDAEAFAVINAGGMGGSIQ